MIGQYIVRCSDSGVTVSLAHLVESEIADRKVTRCGREMHYRNKAGALRMAGPLDRECYRCSKDLRVPDKSIEDVPEPVANDQDDWSPI